MNDGIPAGATPIAWPVGSWGRSYFVTTFWQCGDDTFPFTEKR